MISYTIAIVLYTLGSITLLTGLWAGFIQEKWDGAFGLAVLAILFSALGIISQFVLKF